MITIFKVNMQANKINNYLEQGYLMSCREIAEHMGIVQQSVSRIEAKMLNKIRVGLLKHNVSEEEFFHYIKHLGE